MLGLWIRSHDYFVMSGAGDGCMWQQRDTEVWAEATFGGCDLGDARRTRRLVNVGGQLAAHAGQAPSRACRGDAAANEGAYRLLRNEQVEPAAIAAGGFEATARAAANSVGELLAVEDSTTLSYSHGVVGELGDLGGPKDSRRRGFLVHSVLLLEAESQRTVGLIEQERWCRPPSERGQRHRRHERAYTEKESFKWQRASERMAERLGATLARVISVCDREADVYEYLSYKVAQGERFIVRASWDRCLNAGSARLFEALEQAPVVCTQTVALAQRGGEHARRARTVELEVRAVRVALQAPERTAALGPLTVNAVLAVERHAGRGPEPLRWLLLTQESIGDGEAVRRILRNYALRWRVEDFHKAWKTGAGVEARRMQQADNLERVAVILAFVAVRLLQLRELFDGSINSASAIPVGSGPAISCSGVLEPAEWQVLWVTTKKARPPRAAPSLRWAYETIAKLGGWLDTKRTGRAGWEVIWQGWYLLQERVDAYHATRDFLHEKM